MPFSLTNRDVSLSSAVAVAATTSKEPRGWSFPALLETFATSLPFWLRRFGVQGQDIADAVQDALISFWQDSANIPESPHEARVELLRRVAAVALRARRHAQSRGKRFVLSEEIEEPDPLDVEAWVEARVLLLEALERLDEDTRALLIAHHIEGRTNAEIAAELGEKKNMVKTRVIRGRERLHAEINVLLGEPEKKGKRRANAAILPLGLLGCNAFDKSVIGALLEAEGKIRPLVPPPPPASGVVPIAGSTAPAIVGPVLGALGVLASIVGVLLWLFVTPTSLPRLQPENLEANRVASVVGDVPASRAAAAIEPAPLPCATAQKPDIPAKPTRPNAASSPRKPKAAAKREETSAAKVAPDFAKMEGVGKGRAVRFPEGPQSQPDAVTP